MENGQVQGSQAPEFLTVEERLAALENQAYVTHLQVNGIIDQLVTKGITTVQDIIKSMDGINKEIFGVTEEMTDEELQPAEAPEEV